MQTILRTRLTRCFIVLAALIAAVACGNVKDIAVSSCDVVSITPNGLKSVDVVLALGIHNPTVAFTLSDVEGVVYNDSHELATFGGGPLSVAKKSDDVYELACTASLTDQLSLFEVLNLVRSRNFDGYKIDVSGNVTLANGLKKTLRFKELEITDLMDKAGLSKYLNQ